MTSIKVLSRIVTEGVVPHDVNQGAVQKRHEPHTTEESLRRHRSGRNSQVLPDHPDQVRELLHVILPPPQRVCVKGHLLYSRVDIQLGPVSTLSTSTSMDVLPPKRSLKALG
jgi:hypothetical protein